ncbi:tetratricopeptide repeat protein [Acinetobacter rudis]|uniref:tetratricopeptide repeat protein n=1 Tax=Acinetobacter rudis TaxID=632955 RepID=UPI003341FC22
MTRKICILFLLPLLLDCSKHDNKQVDILKLNNDEENDMYYELNGFVLNELLLSKKEDEAFRLIKNNEKRFKMRDYAVAGDVLLRNNYIDQSIYYLNIAANMGDGEALGRLGEIYYTNVKYKNIDKAIYYFDKSISKNYVSSAVFMASIYLDEEGYVDLNKSIYYSDYAISKKDDLAYYYKGSALAEKGEYELAVENFNEINIVKHPEYHDLAFAKLYAYYKNYSSYNPRKAKKIFEDIFKYSNVAEKYSWLGDFYMMDHEYHDEKKAYELYSKGVEEGDAYSKEAMKDWKRDKVKNK